MEEIQPSAVAVAPMTDAAIEPVAAVEVSLDVAENNPNPSSNSTAPIATDIMSPPPINGHINTVQPVADIHDDDTAADDNLSPPPESMSSGPANAAEDEIVVGTSKTNGHHSSPIRANSEDDVEMGDSDGNKPSVTPYVHNKRKRHSVYNADIEDSINYDDDSTLNTPSGDKSKGHGTTGNKGVPVGYWRESKAINDVDKQMCVAFIDTRDRLRTRQVQLTLDGRPLPKEQIPLGPGGSWVTFDRIVFFEYLVGRDHNEIKEFVRIRTPQMAAGETAEQEEAHINAAIIEAKRRVLANPPGETPNGTMIAYGKDIPESAITARPESKRRKLLDGSSTPQPSAEMIARGPGNNMPAPANSGSRYPLDPLPGTRPTKILLGYWAHSNEPNDADKHAVYGILGANDMFRVKVTRETRDGRTVIGNFPTGAGALWINYEEVIFEPHLTQLTRPEIKEYTRVRQRQLDDGERGDQRLNNETTAVFEAQRRVMCQQNGGEIRPPPPAILPTVANGALADPADDPAFPMNSVRPRRVVAENNSNMGLPVNRPELRQRTSTRTFPAVNAADVVDRSPINSNRPLPVATELRANPRETQLPAVNQSYQPEVYAGRREAMAQGGIDRMEQAHSRIRQRDASRDSTPRSSFMDESHANTNANHGHPASSAVNRSQADLQRLQGVWVDQETNRVRATGSEDEKFHNGIKYERKSSGAFAGKLTSQGNLITIDGKDYVEYRILMVPRFEF